jgi:hypothetical protein
LTAAAAFGVAGASVSLVLTTLAFGAGDTSALGLSVLLATVSAAVSGFILPGTVLRSRVSSAVLAGIFVPVLAQLLYAIQMSIVNLYADWNQDSPWSVLIAFFGFGLMYVAWISLPVGVIVSLWLRKRFQVRAIGL